MLTLDRLMGADAVSKPDIPTLLPLFSVEEEATTVALASNDIQLIFQPAALVDTSRIVWIPAGKVIWVLIVAQAW